MRITTAQNDIEKILFTEEQIKARVKQLGEQISADYDGKAPVGICVLKGASIFFTDVVRKITCPIHMDFLSVSSYGARFDTSGVVRIVKDMDLPIMDRHILIFEDIIDSGLTMQYLIELLSARKPASIKVATMLDKPSRRKCDVQADYKGFDIPDCFVVGYGLDYADNYRNLPYIGALKPEVYS